jgi:ATP-dependent 26S proteasome regulatory subunit
MGNFIRDRRTVEFERLCYSIDGIHKYCVNNFTGIDSKQNMSCHIINIINEMLFTNWILYVRDIREFYVELLEEVDEMKLAYEKLLPFTNNEYEFNSIILNKKDEILNMMKTTKQFLMYNIPEINKSDRIIYDYNGDYVRINPNIQNNLK